MIKRIFFLSLALMAGLATATPNQAQNTQNVSIIQKLKEQYKAFKNKVNDFKNDEEAMENLALGSHALVITTYLFDRSIVLGHEMSHCAASWLTLRPASFYVSPRFRGGGCSQFNGYTLPISESLVAASNIFIFAAGPLGGIITTLGWLKIWNIFMQREGSKNFKECCIKGWEKPLFNENSSLLATAIIFKLAYSNYHIDMLPENYILGDTYGSLSNTILKNDGLQILENLQALSPTLAKMYLPFVQASLMGIIGFGAYGFYKIIKAKYKAHQENKSFVWY